MCQRICTTVGTFCNLIGSRKFFEIDSFPSRMSSMSLHFGNLISWTDIHWLKRKKIKLS